MANPYFKFKQFTVWHDRCAMKVGTDAVLLGGWMNVQESRNLLDVGCGCGLIALMAAQRSKGNVFAVEIDKEAAMQAQENVNESPWNSRIKVINEDFRTFSTDMKFDVIFSNPPYFVNALKCPSRQRTAARHTGELSFEELVSRVAALLTPEGEFSLIVPTETVSDFKAIAAANLLYLSRETQVHTKSGSAPKRTLLAFRPVAASEAVNLCHLDIEQAPGVYSSEFYNMVKEFYL